MHELAIPKEASDQLIETDLPSWTEEAETDAGIGSYRRSTNLQKFRRRRNEGKTSRQ
jgi:hypothetical protein